jgi:hypothetical protein
MGNRSEDGKVGLGGGGGVGAGGGARMLPEYHYALPSALQFRICQNISQQIQFFYF